MISANAYVEELRRRAEEILAENPKLIFEWQGDALAFPAVDPEGFEISVDPQDRGVIVFTALAFHTHFDGPPAQSVGEALALVRDLLSPDMRIRERRSKDKPYRWVLQRRAGKSWVAEAQTSLIVWQYFGHRSDRFYMNQQLPGRLSAAWLRSLPLR